jgi:hypothetical protein
MIPVERVLQWQFLYILTLAFLFIIYRIANIVIGIATFAMWLFW